MATHAKVLLSLVFALGANSAFALGLGEIDLRSYLGQPLDARIPVLAGADEPLDDSCFKLVNGAVTSDTGHSTPAKLSFQQVGRNNILQIRTAAFVPEPAVRIQIEISCGNVSRISREYTLLLDPPEYAASRIDLPSKPVASGQQATTMTQPQSIIQDASSGASAQISADAGLAPIYGVNSTASVTSAAGQSVTPRKIRKAPTETSAPVAKAPARIRPRPSAPIPRPAYKPSAEITAPVEKTPAPAAVASIAKEAPGDGFRLKLSSTEMNLALTKTVTESDRQRLRARQLLLENQSDDQTATILSMKNSIAEMEKQLAELRRQMAAQKGAPVGNVVGMPDLAVAAPGTTTPPVPTGAAPAIEPAKSAAISIPIAKPLPAKQEPGFSLADWTKPALAASLGALLLIFGVNYWRNRGSKETAYKDLYADSTNKLKAPVPAVGQFDENKLFEDGQDDDDLEEILLPEDAQENAKTKALDLPVSATTLSDPRYMIDVQAPDSFKLAYLRERFPEIAQGSLRLDKPDSLIHAARLYYQEDNNSAKAAELLEYAIGEYPNEVRPWLAVFEIYRLENRTADFANLAQRFKPKFEHGGYWPKVQAIGRQIDPQNPLYIAEEFHGDENGDTAISAEAENWLNTPLDFTQDLLGNELRDALLSGDGSPSAAGAPAQHTLKPGELSLSPEGKKPV
ncbi:MAG: hypothetical protein WCD07_06030 [Burkholderiales bacterium]